MLLSVCMRIVKAFCGSQPIMVFPNTTEQKIRLQLLDSAHPMKKQSTGLLIFLKTVAKSYGLQQFQVLLNLIKDQGNINPTKL